jgi:hypothetical protein
MSWASCQVIRVVDIRSTLYLPSPDAASDREGGWHAAINEGSTVAAGKVKSGVKASRAPRIRRLGVSERLLVEQIVEGENLLDP